jgi:hypothetical protein
MKLITSLMLLVFFLSSAMFAQQSSTGLANQSQNPEMEQLKLELMQQQDEANPGAFIKSYEPASPSDAIECPPDALISQPATDFATAYTMDEDAEFSVFQSFTGGDYISGLRFWTISAYFDGAAWAPCTGIDPRPFNIGFYEAGAQPGSEIVMYENLELTRVNTGVTFAGTYPIYEYTAEFDDVFVEEGWFSIQSMIGTAVNCWNLAINQPGGAGQCLQFDGSAYTSQDDPLGFCLIEGSGVQLDVDVALQSIVSPNSGAELGTEDVILTLKNNGIAAESNIPWEVTWTGPLSGTLSGTFTGPIEPGASETVTVGTADLSDYGTYNFEACVNLPGDENPNNDCKTKDVTNSLPVYCDASTSTEDEYIANVLCGDINNSSGWQGGVADYTDIFTNITPGQSEDITVTNGNAWASDIVYCWVDWNMNYEFDQGGDEEFQLTNVGGAGETFTGAITVPAGTPNGNYRMRVRMTYSTPPVPCGSATYGEVEDYTIQVGDPLANDVGVSSIEMAGFYEPGIVTPMATVKNFGTDTQSFDVTMTIGAYSSTKSVSGLAGGATQQVTFDDWNAGEGTYTAEACTDLSGDENPANDCKTKAITVMEGQFVYAYNAYDPSGGLVEGPVTFDLAMPGMVNLLAPTGSSDFIAGATYAADTWWGVQYGGGLYTIDTETGDMTFVGNSPDLSGLAFDGVTVYGASITALYEIDPATGQGTLIGQMGNPEGLMIGIDCNAAGDLFGYDIGDDIFYSINKTTGAATAVGSLGFDFNYAQDMAFDKAADICYLAGYTTEGGLYTVDVTTGAASFLGAFQGGAELTGFAIPSSSTPSQGDPVTEFTAEFQEGVGVVTTWEDPILDIGDWLMYDDGINVGTIGVDGGGTFAGLIKFDPADLTGYDGWYMTKTRFFPSLFVTPATITFQIYEGPDAANLIYEQELTDLSWDEFNTIALDQPHVIDASTELYFGFEVTHVAAETPLGHGNGPATAGYSDVMYYGGQLWSMSADFGIDINWNIHGLVAEEMDGVASEKQLIVKNYENLPLPTFTTKENRPTSVSDSRADEFLGVNIYQNGSKVNDEMIAPGVKNYTHVFFEPGTYQYTAKAVYDDGESVATDPPVEVIIDLAGISVSPASMNETHGPGVDSTTQSLTITNTGLGDLEWSIEIEYDGTKSAAPEIDMAEAQRVLEARMAADPRLSLVDDQSPLEPRKDLNAMDAQWDVLYSFSAIAASCQAVATDGNHFYMTYWNISTGQFDKFDMDGNFLESFNISGAGAIRDFAYDGEYFYGAPNGGMSIARLDLANQTLVNTIPISSSSGVTGSRHLAYDPGLDNGNGGFWLGQWSELAAIDMSGNTIYSNSQTPAVESCYGSAYDNYSTPDAPKLWLFTQNAGSSPDDLVLLEEFDINSLSFTGTTMDLFTISGNIPGYIPGTAGNQTIAGGCEAYIDANNKFVLAVNFQQSPNLVAGLELAEAGAPATNDVRISSIVSPNTGMALGIEDVIVKVQNLGTNAQSNIPFEVHVDGALFYSGSVAGPLAQGESEDVFCGTIDLSEELGEWFFEACTMLAGDENPDNDCKTKTVIHLEPMYCDASTSTEDEYIANVLCGTIDNSSGWQGGVADYTDISTMIIAGQSQDITVTNGNAWASDIVYCWVDWNKNYEFDQGGNEEFQLTNVGGAGETFTGAIAVPAGTPNGEYRMRVRMTYSTPPVPCGSAAYGEVEDYTIVVTGGSGGDGWLSVDMEEDTLEPGDSEVLTVEFNSSELEQGVYMATIKIASNDFLNPEIMVPVTLTKIVGQAEIEWDPDEFTFVLDYNSSDMQMLNVSNVGAQQLECTMSITYGESVASSVAPPIGGSEISETVTPDMFLKANAPSITDAIECPADALLSQAATDFATAYTMDEDAGYWVFQSLPIGGNIDGIRFWTISAFFDGAAWVPCDGIDPRPFDVGFWTNNGGTPGDNIVTFEDIMLTRVNTGVTFAGTYPVYEYTATFPNTTVEAGQWFSLQSKVGTAVNCWNLALNQPGGQGSVYQYDGATFTPQDDPLGFCLIGEEVMEWLSISPTTGSVAPGGSAEFDVTATSDSLPIGTYNAIINMATNDPNNLMVDIDVTLDITTGIHSPANEKAHVMMFPNPTKDQVNISTNFELSKVQIMNQTGQVVLETKASGNGAIVKTSQLQPGVYFVKIVSEAGESTHKLIIQ